MATEVETTHKGATDRGQRAGTGEEEEATPPAVRPLLPMHPHHPNQSVPIPLAISIENGETRQQSVSPTVHSMTSLFLKAANRETAKGDGVSERGRHPKCFTQ